MPINKLTAKDFNDMGEQHITLHRDTVNSLSAEALAAWAYLSGKPPQWKVRVEEVRAHFGWGDFLWRKVSRELRERGLMSIVAAKGKDGRIESRKIVLKETAEK